MKGFENFSNLPERWTIKCTIENEALLNDLILDFFNSKRIKILKFHRLEENYCYGSIGYGYSQLSHGYDCEITIEQLKTYIQDVPENSNFDPTKNPWYVHKPIEKDYINQERYAAIKVKMRELGLYKLPDCIGQKYFGFNGTAASESNGWINYRGINLRTIHEVFSALNCTLTQAWQHPPQKATTLHKVLNLKKEENVGKSINVPRKTATVARGEIPTVTRITGRKRPAIIASYDCTAEARAINC